MTAFLQITTNFSTLNLPPNDCSRKQSFWGLKLPEPLNGHTLSRRKIEWVCRCWLTSRVYGERSSFLRVTTHKGGIFIGDRECKKSNRVLLVRFNKGFGFNGLGGGGGGGGGKDDGTTARVLGNLTLAILLTYLTMTGQLGWVLDTIVSLWV